MTATLLIERAPGGWADSLRAYEVIVNEEKRAELCRGEKRTIEVDPGQTEIYLKIDWCRSKIVHLSLGEGSEARLSCRPRLLFTVLYAVIFSRNNYMRLEVNSYKERGRRGRIGLK